MAEDSEWIFASVINFLQSPLWAAPVFKYVDNNCIFFDKEEENKLEYTTIHDQYRELVEGLIEQHIIKELNITEEQFLTACQKESENSYSKVLFDQVLSADDFVTFKKMMFRRNMALENAALATIQLRDKAAPAVAATATTTATPALKDVGTPDEQIETAIRLSKEAYERDLKKNQDTGDDDIKKAIERSMKDKADLDEISKREMDDIEAAIALSLAAQKDAKYGSMKEEERWRVLEMQQSLLRKQTSNDDKQHQVLLELQRQRLLDEDRQNAANSALDRLFARRRILHDEEERLTAELDEEAKEARHQQILEARHKMLEQSNNERETELKEYLAK
jgi:hypothetical protein